MFYDCFLILKNEKFAHSLFFGEQCERIDQITHQKSLRSFTKNEQMSKLLVFLSESLIWSFFCKKRAICSENQWANSQPCFQDQKQN